MTRRKSLTRIPPPEVAGVQLRATGHLSRPEILTSRTYKISPQGISHKIYITVSDHKVEGQVRPFEVFMSSKYTEGFQFMTALMRLISSRLQEPGPFPGFVIQELIDTFDTGGGYWVQEPWLRENGRGLHTHGIVSHIGLVLKYHCESLGVAISTDKRPPSAGEKK